MTRTLDAAIAKLAALPPDEQDRVGRWLLDELADEEQWAQGFEACHGALTKLAPKREPIASLGRRPTSIPIICELARDAAVLGSTRHHASRCFMTKPIQAVLADALRLDTDARAELAAELLASLDGPADADAESAWDAEIERRINQIEAGEVRLEPWESVKRRIEKNILGR